MKSGDDITEMDPMGKTSHQQKVQLAQATELYDWQQLKPSAVCGCFRFVLQLVLVGCCGSFLFGFNISLLNTAINVIFSEYQICGQPQGIVQYFLDIKRAGNDTVSLEFENDHHLELEEAGCTRETVASMTNEMRFQCVQGYTDLYCDSYKWFIALIQTAVLIGGAFGALTAGRLVRYGRRRLLLIIMVVFGIGIVGSVCANSFSSLMLARLVVGLGVGMVSVGSPTYISEVTPAHERGKFGVFHQLSITVGIFVGILIGLPLPDPAEQQDIWMPNTFSMFWWRFMLGIGLTPVLLGVYFLAMNYTFETPIYYVEQHCYQDAHNILERVYGKQDVKSELDVCIDTVRAGADCKNKGLTLGTAFQNPEYRQVLIVGLGLAGFQQFGGINVFVTSSSDLFKKAGLSKTWQTGMSILMAAINVLMTFPTILLIERMGRKQLLFLGSLGQVIVLLPVAVWYWTEADPADPGTPTQVLSIIAVIGFVVFFAVAFGPIVWVYLFEIFPMELKDTASSTCTAFNWVGAIIMVFVANVLPNQVSFTLFAVLQLLATLFVWFFMKETKGLALGLSPYISVKQEDALLA